MCVCVGARPFHLSRWKCDFNLRISSHNVHANACLIGIHREPRASVCGCTYLAITLSPILESWWNEMELMKFESI